MKPVRTSVFSVIGNALRPVLVWLMHSPWRLGTVVCALIVAAYFFHGGAGPEDARAKETEKVASPYVSPVVPTSTTSTTNAMGDAPTSAELYAENPADVARAFARRWARPDVEKGRWFSEIRPFLADHARDGLSETDPKTVPVKRVNELISVVEGVKLTEVAFATDAKPIKVTMLFLSGHWKVQGILGIDDAAPRPSSTEDDSPRPATTTTKAKTSKPKAPTTSTTKTATPAAKATTTKPKPAGGA